MFHVYNKFDSMDCIHVSAKTEQEAVELAIADGHLTENLGVSPSDLAAYPFSNSDQTSSFVRRINANRVIEAGL